jgi:hypothetical protein
MDPQKHLRAIERATDALATFASEHDCSLTRHEAATMLLCDLELCLGRENFAMVAEIARRMAATDREHDARKGA